MLCFDLTPLTLVRPEPCIRQSRPLHLAGALVPLMVPRATVVLIDMLVEAWILLSVLRPVSTDVRTVC